MKQILILLLAIFFNPVSPKCCSVANCYEDSLFYVFYNKSSSSDQKLVEEYLAVQSENPIYIYSYDSTWSKPIVSKNEIFTIRFYGYPYPKMIDSTFFLFDQIKPFLMGVKKIIIFSYKCDNIESNIPTNRFYSSNVAAILSRWIFLSNKKIDIIPFGLNDLNCVFNKNLIRINYFDILFIMDV